MRNKIHWHGGEGFWPGTGDQRMLWLSQLATNRGFEVREIHYHAIDDQSLLAMNEKHLGHNTLTDIITFDYSKDKWLSGEVYISWERVMENATTLKIRSEEERLRVIAHGLLHMMGEQDKTAEDKKNMRRAEDAALLSWKMFHVEHGR